MTQINAESTLDLIKDNIISNNTKSTISLIENYETCHEKVKIPYKRQNFKHFMYQKRLRYGSLCKTGLVNDKLRFFPNLEIINNNKAKQNEISLSELVRVPENEIDLENNHSKENIYSVDNNEFFRKLLYNTEFNLNIRESRREIKLKTMLEEKILILAKLNNKSNKNN
jgi:hypothetical protein